MKAMLKYVLFLLTVVLLCHCRKEIEPNIVNIPDDNFLNALIELGVDTNGDGIISPAEAEVVTNLNIGGDSIANMTGIEAFTNLDVSENKALKKLRCIENFLTSLDVSKNTALSILLLNDMPSLNKVCVWEMPFPPAGVTVDSTGSPNVYFTTDCN